MSEAFFTRASRLASDALDRRADAATTAVNNEQAEWQKRSNVAPWSYGHWPLAVQALCVAELAVRSNCVLEAIKQAQMALPQQLNLESDRDALKRWAHRTLASYTVDLERLLAEHVKRTAIASPNPPDLIFVITRQQDTLALAIDQFVDTERNRGLTAATSIVIQGDGIAIVGDVKDSTIQQGITGKDLALIVEAVDALRKGLAAVDAPEGGKVRAEEALAVCAEELAKSKPSPSRLVAFLTTAGEVYRTIGATPGALTSYELARDVLVRMLP